MPDRGQHVNKSHDQRPPHHLHRDQHHGFARGHLEVDLDPDNVLQREEEDEASDDRNHQRRDGESRDIEKVLVAPSRARRPRTRHGHAVTAVARIHGILKRPFDHKRRRRLLRQRRLNRLTIHAGTAIAVRFFHGCIYRNSRLRTPPRTSNTAFDLLPCWVRLSRTLARLVVSRTINLLWSARMSSGSTRSGKSVDAFTDLLK